MAAILLKAEALEEPGRYGADCFASWLSEAPDDDGVRPAVLRACKTLVKMGSAQSAKMQMGCHFPVLWGRVSRD